MKKDMNGLYMTAIVACVAVVALVVLVMNGGGDGMALSDADMAGQAFAFSNQAGLDNARTLPVTGTTIELDDQSLPAGETIIGLIGGFQGTGLINEVDFENDLVGAIFIEGLMVGFFIKYNAMNEVFGSGFSPDSFSGMNMNEIMNMVTVSASEGDIAAGTDGYIYVYTDGEWVNSGKKTKDKKDKDDDIMDKPWLADTGNMFGNMFWLNGNSVFNGFTDQYNLMYGTDFVFSADQFAGQFTT